MTSKAHQNLVEIAIDWLKSHVLSGPIYPRYSVISFELDKEMVWKVHPVHDVVYGIYPECWVLYPRIPKLYAALSRLKAEISLTQDYLEPLKLESRLATAEYRKLERKINNIIQKASELRNNRYAGPRIIDVVCIAGDRHVAIECGNTKYSVDSYPEFFTEVIFIPYPKEGSGPQLIWGRWR